MNTSEERSTKSVALPIWMHFKNVTVSFKIGKQGRRPYGSPLCHVPRKIPSDKLHGLTANSFLPLNPTRRTAPAETSHNSNPRGAAIPKCAVLIVLLLSSSSWKHASNIFPREIRFLRSKIHLSFSPNSPRGNAIAINRNHTSHTISDNGICLGTF